MIAQCATTTLEAHLRCGSATAIGEDTKKRLTHKPLPEDPMRRAARKDDNHQQIVKALREVGCYVLDISQLKNCCDLLVAKGGRWVAMEIKDGSKPPSARKLTAGEQTFFDQAAHRAPVRLVTNVTEAIQAIL